MESEVNGPNETPAFKLEDSLYFKVAEKVFPGLVDAALANGVDLVDIQVNGSASARIMGIVSSSPGWMDSGNLVDIVAGNTDGWAGHVLNFKPLKFRQISDKYVLSTALTDSPVGNNRRSIVDANLPTLGVRFGGDYFSTLNEVFSAGVVTNLDIKDAASGSGEEWPEMFRGSSQVGGDMVGFRCDLDEFGYSTLNSLIANMGYQIDRSSPLLKATRKPASHASAEKKPMTWTQAQSVAKLTSGHGYTDASCIRNMVRFGCWSSKPGMKYIPFIFNWWDPESALTIMVYHVPVVDDGNADFLCLIHCEESGKQYAVVGHDCRYGGQTSGITIEQKNYMISRHTGFSEVVTPLGATYSLDRVPTESHGQAIASLGDNILAFLMPPINDQHIFGSRVSRSTKEFIREGKPGRLHEVTLTSSFYACKLPKDWYSTYYKTGFGLFQPRSSNIQKNVLDEWNKLDFQEFAICIDSVYSTINPEIVEQLPIAREYKRMREKACKDDNWLAQRYGGELTYGDIKSRIQHKPKLSAFYAVSGVSGDVEFTQLERRTFTWAREVGEDNTTVTYVRSEGEDVERYSINDTTRDLILNEWTEASSVGFTTTVFCADFNLSDSDKAELNSGIEITKNPYWRDSSPLKGYILAEQYYAPEEGLTMSGYPVYRHMHSPFREQMVLRCYADLNKIGEPLTRIVKSFTSDAIINKILSK